jgi:hypothetical protein
MFIKHTLLVSSFVLIAMIFPAGCVQRIGPTGNPAPILQKTPQDTGYSTVTSPAPQTTQSAQTLPVLPTVPGSEDLSADLLVTKIIDNLAGRISLDPEKVSVVEATSVNWPDTSLGCPQPGIEYAQVLTPGFRIVLEARGERYEYHTGRDDQFILCSQDASLIEPIPVMPVAPHGKPPKCMWTPCP